VIGAKFTRDMPRPLLTRPLSSPEDSHRRKRASIGSQPQGRFDRLRAHPSWFHEPGTFAFVQIEFVVTAASDVRLAESAVMQQRQYSCTWPGNS
jgi:hypothetical protein